MGELFSGPERERLGRYFADRRAAERFIRGAREPEYLAEIDEVEALIDRPRGADWKASERLRSWADAMAHRACERLIAGDLGAARDAAETYRLLDMLWQAR